MSKAPKLQKDRATGIWSIHWTDAGPRGQRGRSRRISTRETDLPAAEAFFATWLKLERGTAPPGQTFTVADLWSVYNSKHVEVNTADGGHRHAQAWKNLGAHFGDKTATQVDEDLAARYRQKRHAGAIGFPANDSTVRLELLLLLACFNWCANPKRKPPLIAKADVPLLELPPPGEPNDRWLTTDEIREMFAAARESRRGDRMSRGERFLWLALETGSRKTAIFELTWDRVDFETGVIHYERPGRRKTKKRRSSVPISETLRPVLEQMHRERIGDLVMDNEADVDLILSRLGANAGVEGVTPHVLRHTFATHKARLGVPLWIIAKILGNTVAMVERVYAKHCPDDLRAAVNLRSDGAQFGFQSNTTADIRSDNVFE